MSYIPLGIRTICSAAGLISGGTLIAGLIVGHFGHFGKLDMRISKKTLNLMRELGLVLFLVGAGVPGGVNFVSAFNWIYICFGSRFDLRHSTWNGI